MGIKWFGRLSIVFSPPISEAWTAQKRLAESRPQSYNAGSQRHENAPSPSRETVSGKGQGAFLTTFSATVRCGAHGNGGFRE